jgi:NAD(P)H-flavin reductase/hemoglobin-like flavoprotein
MGNLSELLKESWDLVEDQDKLASQFYARVFMLNPQLRDLFPVQMNAQREKLVRAIVKAVQTSTDPTRFDEHLRGLGRDHRKFYIQAEDYDVVGVALLGALRAFVGDRWTVEYEQAWSDAYQVIAQKMIAGAESDDSRPPLWFAEVLTHERRGRRGEIAVITCKPLQPMEYKAGQYVSLECSYQPRLWRTYSMANAPSKDNVLEFHVRAVGGSGWVSGALVRRVKPGDMIRLAAPMGSMTLDRTSTRDMVCVCGGTGAAPIKALVEEMTQVNSFRFIHVFVGARHRDDLYALDEFYKIAADHPWLQVVPVCSDDPTFDGGIGHVCDVMRDAGPWSHHDLYVSGPPPMVAATLQAAATLEIPPAWIRYDTVNAL